MTNQNHIAQQVGKALRETGETLSVAESCTGGLVGSLITDIPGSSDYFVGGIISYMEQTKLQRLAVSREAVEQHGTVSKPVAREMAQHIRDEADASWGVSTTGYAGPVADSTDGRIGSVYIGIAYAGDPNAEQSYSIVEHHKFEGGRHEVKNQIAIRALKSVLAQIQSGQ